MGSQIFFWNFFCLDLRELGYLDTTETQSLFSRFLSELSPSFFSRFLSELFEIRKFWMGEILRNSINPILYACMHACILHLHDLYNGNASIMDWYFASG